MIDADFRDLVRRMRAKQRDYFREKDATVLRECKDLERRVDAALDGTAASARPSLFDANDQEGE